MTQAYLGPAHLVDLRSPAEPGAAGRLHIVRLARDEDGLIASLPANSFLGVMIDGVQDGADVQRFGAALAVFEARSGLEDGSLILIARIASGAGLLALGSFANASSRLRGIAWDGEAFARDIGARSARTETGAWTALCATARSLVLAAAASAGVEAIDAPFADANEAGFRREAEEAARDGFRRKVALSPLQAKIAAEIFG